MHRGGRTHYVKEASFFLFRYLQPLLFVIVAPLLLVLLGYWYLDRIHILLLAEMERRIFHIAEQGTNIIDARLQARTQVLETLASHPVIMDEKVPLERKIALLRSEEKRLNYVRLGLARITGEASTTDGQQIFVNDRKYFLQAKYGAPHISEVLISRLDKRTSVAHAVPVRNAAGDVIAVIFATEEAPLLAGRLNVRFSYEGTGTSLLMDANGMLLDAHGELENIFKKIASENSPETVGQFRRRINTPDSALSRIVYNGEKVYAGTMRVPSTGGWQLMLMVPETALTLQVRPALSLTVGTLAATVLLLIVSGLYIMSLRRGYLRQRGFAEAAIHSAGIYQVETDAKGQILNCNTLFTRKMGWKEDDHLPNLHDLALGQNREDMENALNNRQPFAQKLRGVNDEVLYVQWHVLSTQHSKALVLLGTDFSAREQAAVSQRTAAAMRDMQQVFDNIPMPMSLRDTDNHLRHANRTLRALAGNDDVESNGKRFGGKVPDHEIILLNEAFHRVLQTKASVCVSHTSVDADGSLRHYENTQTPLLDENNAVTCVVSMSADVTDSIRVQQHLKQEVQRLRDLLDSSPVGVIIVVQGQVRFRNLRARQLVGLEVGSNLSDVPVVEGDPAAMVEQLLTKPVIRDVPFTLMDPRKRLRHLLLTASNTQLEGESGTLIWAVDVTAIKDVEKQLIQARDDAEAATRAKSDFLATMSHEIRTPMNAVLGFIHLFERSNLTQRQLDYLEKISISATGLLRIINDILDFSKIEAGRLEIENIPFHLSACVDAAHSIMGFSARDKGLELITKVAPDVPELVLGDGERLNQVLINLLNNAVKFTTSGTITLDVSLLHRHEDGSLVLSFQISDTGIGMNEEQIARIFQPFSQADTSTTRKFGGTGLGLVICRRLVELMGGHIELTSKVGQGTTFTFTVRCHSAHQSELPAADVTTGTETDPLAHVRGARVLVVEDNEINQEIAGAMLSQLGMEVDFADDGQEALDKVDEKDYALIFMDMQMPGMDGLEATRRIRAKGALRPELKLLPIVAMTANAMLNDRRRCLEAGMNDHLAKPFSPQGLQTLLMHWLKVHPQE